MTKKQFDSKFDEMAAQVPAMLAEYKRAVHSSGALDLESAGDDYLLPKGALWAALYDIAGQWLPHSKDAEKSARNLRLCSYPDFTRIGTPESAVITIRVHGGVVQDVEDVPPGVTVRVVDYDCEGASDDDTEDVGGERAAVALYEGGAE